jgi:hypothetical protein
MIDVEVLVETFAVMKEYVPVKDRQAVADHLFSILTDLDGISEKDLKVFAQSDPCLAKACEEYFQDDEEEDEDNYDYDDDRDD